jgi:hypothetical protein
VSVIPDYESSAKLRERAEKCRLIAGTYDDAETRDQMLRIAAAYDEMADGLEHDATATNSKQMFQRMVALVQSIEQHHIRANVACREIRVCASLSRGVIATTRMLLALTEQRFRPNGPHALGANPDQLRQT